MNVCCYVLLCVAMYIAMKRVYYNQKTYKWGGDEMGVGNHIDREYVTFSSENIIAIMDPVIFIKDKIKILQSFSEEIAIHPIIL
jgi:hypothetical protein